MLHGRPQTCEDVKVCRYFKEYWTCSLHVLCFFRFSSLRFHWPPSPHTPHTRTQLCKKPRKVCHHWTFGAPCLAIAQLMDRLRERCVQDLLPEFTGNVAPFFQFVMIPSNGFIDVYSQVRSHTESYGMPCCHGACHSFDDSRKKTKTCWFEVPGTWPHPHCCCTPGQCPRILSPFTISNCQNQMNLKKLTTSHRFGTKSCSSVWHTSWSAFPMFAVQQEDVHIGLHFTHAI